MKKITEKQYKKFENININKEERAITLIALVITIVILLILAGVALSLTVGENGLFTRAQNAADTWQMAEQNEQKEIEQVGNFLDDYTSEYNKATTVSYAKQLNKPFENDTTIRDDLDNEVRIPAGFKIAQDSATLVEDGIVIEDGSGNQFVWIPISTNKNPIIYTTLGNQTINYTRTAFCEENITTDYTETLPSDEEASVNKNGGYYIGRFEAGDGNALDFRSGAKEGKVVIKKNQVPYNYITIENAVIKATEMTNKQGYTAITKLVSSYAWDTAINFIQIKNNNYGSNTLQGNYSGTLMKTGRTSPVSNIYDMGGNLWERSTEHNLIEDLPSVCRGGYYKVDNGQISAGYRSNDSGADSIYFGFRVTLFLK